MRVLQLLAKDLRITLRDRGALAGAFAFPLMLATILGLVFGGEGPTATSTVPVVVVDLDRSEMSAGLLGALTASGLVSAQVLDDSAEATTIAARGYVAAAILIPEGFGAVATGQAPGPVTVRILRDPASGIWYQVVTALVESYVARVEAGLIAGGAAIRANVEHAGPLAIPGLHAGLASAAPEVLGRERVRVTPETSGTLAGASGSIMQALVPGFVILALLFTASNMAGKLLEERNLNTLARLLSSPMDRAEIVTAKAALTLVFAVIQIVVLMIVTYLVWGIQWGPALPAAIVAIGAAIGVAGFGSLLTAMVGSRESGAAASTMVITVMSLLGGSFWPIEQFPDFMQTISKFTVNRWAILSFRHLGEGDLTGAFTSLGPVLLLGIAGLVVGAVLLGRRDGAN